MQDLEINVGLYRDDGLAACSQSPQQVELIKKKMCKIFADNGLKITIEANKKCIDFLDITMDLRSATYKPYTKPNNNLLYVHRESNHPPSVIKNIPESINRRLSNISSNEAIFANAAPQYQEALKKSGYNHELKFDPTTPNPDNNDQAKKRSRKRNITWFNPPYSDTVATNIGKKFLTLLDQCFPPDHQLRKIFNRNTIKLSYSCMPNMKQIISAHNKSKLQHTNNTDPPTNDCNCRNQALCPLNGNCLVKSVVYQATVKREDNDKEETYIGLTEGNFKIRYNTHKSSFNNATQRNVTALSKYVWSLVDRDIRHSISWKILARAKSYSRSSKRCNLCLTEKYYIITKPAISTLNNRNELASSCRHRKKHLLSHFN